MTNNDKELEKILKSQKCIKCNEPTIVTKQKRYKINNEFITKYELICKNGHKNFLSLPK